VLLGVTSVDGVERGDIILASAYFETAVRHGSPFEAYYYLAAIQASQAAKPNMPPIMAASACAVAVSFYKLVAERGVWDDDLLKDGELAWNSGTDRGKEIAMLKWWVAAERGSEIAQNNLAYVWDQGGAYHWHPLFPDSFLVQIKASCDSHGSLRPRHPMIQQH
jgi:SEL1 protein